MNDLSFVLMSSFSLIRCKDTVENGGKVLIPVFALGRAQELCLLIDSFWKRQNLQAPIYFAAGIPFVRSSLL